MKKIAILGHMAALSAAAAMLEAGATLMPALREPGKPPRVHRRRSANYVARKNKTFKLKGIRP